LKRNEVKRSAKYDSDSDSEDDWIDHMTEPYAEEKRNHTTLFSYSKPNAILNKLLT
jgi:hypothetical protein